MNRRPNLRQLALGLSVIIVLAACVASGSGSAEPSVSASATASPQPTATPTTQSSATPTAQPTSNPASPSAAACTLPSPGPLASNTLVNASLERTSSGARLVFTFGSRPPDSVAEPTIAIVFDEPPFSMAGSGQPVTVAGQRFLMVRMNGMVYGKADGSPVYEGERNLRLAGATIPQAVLVDDFEGVVSWIVGLDGPGCPSVSGTTSSGGQLVIELDR
jgi:hypothetical protein